MSADFGASTAGCEGCGCTGHRLGDWNLTYNLSPMLRATGLWPEYGWSEVLGVQGSRHRPDPDDPVITIDHPPATGRSVVERFTAIAAELRANPGKYLVLNPENGWGSYDQLLRVLDDVIEKVGPHPDAKWDSWL